MDKFISKGILVLNNGSTIILIVTTVMQTSENLTGVEVSDLALVDKLDTNMGQI